MNASTFQIIAIVCFIIATVFLLITIYLFFHYDIRSVYQFLSGKSAIREIDEIKTMSNRVTGHQVNQVLMDLESTKTEKIYQDYLNVSDFKANQSPKFDSKSSSEMPTTVLGGVDTTVLNSETIDLSDRQLEEEIKFCLEEEIKIIHSDVII